MHFQQVMWWCEGGGASRGAAPDVGSFALWRPHKERPRAQLLAYDAQQLGASSTALWQPGLVPVPKQNLESKKLPDLAHSNILAIKKKSLYVSRREKQEHKGHLHTNYSVM